MKQPKQNKQKTPTKKIKALFLDHSGETSLIIKWIINKWMEFSKKLISTSQIFSYTFCLFAGK